MAMISNDNENAARDSFISDRVTVPDVSRFPSTVPESKTIDFDEEQNSEVIGIGL